MKVFIKWQDQFGYWKHYTMRHHQQDAYRSAVLRAKQTGKRHKLEDENGTLIDLINPSAKSN